LAANVLDTATGSTLFPATALREVGGVKIGFIGLTLRATPSVVTPAGVAGLQFLSEVATVNQLVPQLKAQGAAAVVVLIHQGGQTSARTVQDKTCPDFSGPILALADQFDKAVDVVVSGHTHQEYVCLRPDGKLITQTGFYGRLVTLIDLQIDVAGRKVISKDANNFVVLNGATVKDSNGNPLPLPQGANALLPDPAVEQIVRRYGDLTAPLSEMEVGRLAAPLERRANAAGESTLGAVIADAFLAGTSDRSYGDRAAQIAFTNPGGLRSDLSSSLAVTFGQLFNVLPFNNSLVTMDLSGAQLLRLLEQQWERPQPAGGRILPVSNGFSYTWDASQPEGAAPSAGHRVVPGSLRLQGRPIAMDKTYRVTVNSFMASGGDALSVFKQGRNVQEGENDLVVAKLYFRLKGILPPPQMGRILRLH
jgi:5'-nucleotidase